MWYEGEKDAVTDSVGSGMIHAVGEGGVGVGDKKRGVAGGTTGAGGTGSEGDSERRGDERH